MCVCFICFNLQIQCLVSHSRLGIKYCYVFLMFVYMLYLICDTQINYYLLTYLHVHVYRYIYTDEGRDFCFR